MTPEERKEYARRILENPLWQEAFEAAKHDLYRLLVNVALTDKDEQQAIAASAQWLEVIQRHFETALQADKVTQFNLEQRKKVI